MTTRIAGAIKVLFMARDVLAKARGRWLAIPASLVVSAAMIYAQSTEHLNRVEPPAAAAPAIAPFVPPNPPHVASPAEAESLAASAPAAGQPFQVALPRGVASEDRLQVKTIWAARAVSLLFPQIKTIYGYRQDSCRGTRMGWRST